VVVVGGLVVPVVGGGPVVPVVGGLVVLLVGGGPVVAVVGGLVVPVVGGTPVVTVVVVPDEDLSSSGGGTRRSGIAGPFEGTVSESRVTVTSSTTVGGAGLELRFMSRPAR
jgi:hypothetical protein